MTARDVRYARRWDDVMRIVRMRDGLGMASDSEPTGNVAQD